MKKQFTIFLILLLFSSLFFITKNVSATCSSPADRGYKQCSKNDRYAIDSWYNSQMANLRKRGLTFSGTAVVLQNEYQLKISGCEEDNNNYAQALSDYEECLKQAEEQKQLCTSYSWLCSDWGTCSSNGMKFRICNKILDCEGGVQSPNTSQSCTYIPACSADTWQCGSWGVCSSQGTQTRSCNKIYDCSSVETAAPATTQSCTYTPVCTADTWQCDNWSICSPQKIQTRNCSKTFDCSYTETAPPATSQYCEAPYEQVQQIPTDDTVIISQEKNNNAETQTVIDNEKKMVTKADNSLSKRVSGNILLQVEKNGEGWYVYPSDKKKYYLGRPADAFSIMRNLGLGIKHNELTNYLNAKFPSRLSGKILLDVEQNGEAYYVNPNDLKGYYLNRPSDAFKIMRELGLGITNTDIRKIDVGEI